MPRRLGKPTRQNVRLVCTLTTLAWRAAPEVQWSNFGLTIVCLVINIHGGAFHLGSSKMVNKDQVADCLSRGWIVIAPNHRLCPQVTLLDGPMRDCRDLLGWVYDGGLQKALDAINADGSYAVDTDHVFAFGTSSGGTLSLALVSSCILMSAGHYNYQIQSKLIPGSHYRALELTVPLLVFMTCTGLATSHTRSGRSRCRTWQQNCPKVSQRSSWTKSLTKTQCPSSEACHWKVKRRGRPTLMTRDRRSQ